MTTLTLLKKWNGFPKGHTIQYDDVEAKKLIAQGIAEIPGKAEKATEKPEFSPDRGSKIFGKK